MTPRTRYAVNGGVNIAYQVGGEGPDLVIVPGFVSHLEMDWAGSDAAAFLKRLSSFCRLIRLDKRGTGLSDPSAEIPTLETRMEDVHAVLDEVGSERAALLGYSEGGLARALPISEASASADQRERRRSALLGVYYARASMNSIAPGRYGIQAQGVRQGRSGEVLERR